MGIPGLVSTELLCRPAAAVFNGDHPAVGQEEVDRFSHAHQVHLPGREMGGVNIYQSQRKEAGLYTVDRCVVVVPAEAGRSAPGDPD